MYFFSSFEKLTKLVGEKIDWILKEHAHEKRPYEDYVPNEEPLENGFATRLKAGSNSHDDKKVDDTNGILEEHDDAGESDALIRVSQMI